MNKQKFTNIVKDYHSISADDRNKLHDLVNSYPYSQIIHILVAKANLDAKTDIAKQTLAYAAMYSADRSVLKEIIASSRTAKQKPASKEAQKPATSAPKEQEVLTSKAEEKVANKETPDKSKRITIDPSIFKTGEPSLSDTILKDLDDLKQSKASYLEWLNLPGDGDDEPTEAKKPSKKATTTKKAKSTKTTSKPEKKSEVKPSSKKTAKAATKKVTSKSAGKPVTTKTKSSGKAAQKKSESSDPDKNDQTKIIEKFISQEPSITAKASRKSPENQEDLSIASTSFNEDLVSENLAKIMISQGKTDKAIDIYKKLIWKFPQKKAYFATQIEELKNK